MVKWPPPGGMAEWFKATDLKSVVAARPPGVRIPLPPLGVACLFVDMSTSLHVVRLCSETCDHVNLQFENGEVPEWPIGLAC